MDVSKIGVPQNGWFIVENPIKIGDLGIPLFLETPISSSIQYFTYVIGKNLLIQSDKHKRTAG